MKEVLWDDGRVFGIRGRQSGGRDVTEHAPVVVGADGLRSTVARAVRARVYGERPPLTHSYYTYWSGFSQDALGLFVRPWVGAGVAPKNDGLTIINVGWAVRQFPDVRDDIERRDLEAMHAFPELADRLTAASREERFAGMPNVPMFFREAAGPGWVLAGDAGYHKDPAQGITERSGTPSPSPRPFGALSNTATLPHGPTSRAVATRRRSRSSAGRVGSRHWNHSPNRRGGSSTRWRPTARCRTATQGCSPRRSHRTPSSAPEQFRAGLAERWSLVDDLISGTAADRDWQGPYARQEQGGRAA